MPTNESHVQRNPYRGVRGVIARMFSGFVMNDESAETEQRAVVDTGTSSATVSTVAIVRKRDDLASFDVDVLATITGPRVYPLPNSPTGWTDLRHGVRVGYGDALHDPARPDGLITDVLGLGTDDEHH